MIEIKDVDPLSIRQDCRPSTKRADAPLFFCHEAGFPVGASSSLRCFFPSHIPEFRSVCDSHQGELFLDKAYRIVHKIAYNLSGRLERGSSIQKAVGLRGGAC
ncbi:MAG: hypothetical protein C4576_08620 [Desulfobacteraceae bacterium]|nr:MAG: hypothetical protein C4576_08620 [Desulfobacteraceae bacterium]